MARTRFSELSQQVRDIVRKSETPGNDLADLVKTGVITQKVATDAINWNRYGRTITTIEAQCRIEDAKFKRGGPKTEWRH